MIKGIGYLKSLKQLLFILLISCFIFGLGSFANCRVVEKIGNYSTSPYQNNIQTEVISKGSFLSQRLGTTKPFFTWISQDNKRAYLWWKNGLPYFYEYFNSYSDYGLSWAGFNQGFVESYFVCNELTQNSNSPSGCSKVEIGVGSVYEFQYFLSKVYSSDYFGYDLDIYYQHYVRPRLCISSHEVGLSLCLQGRSHGYDSNSVNLTGSLGIASNIDFQNIESYYYDYNSPAISVGGGGGNIGGGGGMSASFTDGGNITLGCNNSFALDYYHSNGYSSKLCYGGINNTAVMFGEGLSYIYNTPGVGVDLFTIYNNSLSGVENHLQSICRYGEYCTDGGISDFYKYWRIEYDSYSKGYNTGLFNNVPFAIFNISKFMETYGLKFNSKSVVDYCTLELGKVNLGDLYTGYNQSNICSSVNSTVNYNAGTGEVVVGNDVLGMGSGLTTFTNGSTFIDNTVNKVKSYWRIPNKSDFGLGLLPTYILSFLCLIIIFRFISH